MNGTMIFPRAQYRLSGTPVKNAAIKAQNANSPAPT